MLSRSTRNNVIYSVGHDNSHVPQCRGDPSIVTGEDILRMVVYKCNVTVSCTLRPPKRVGDQVVQNTTAQTKQ